MLGALLSLCDAIAFSVNAILVRRGVVLVSPSQATLITVLMGIPMFLLASLVTGQLLRFDELSGLGYLYLGTGGVINFVAGRLFNYRAIDALGAARSAPFQALSLPYSVFIAFVFLGEGISLFMGIGVLLVMIGPLIMVERRRVPNMAAVGVSPVVPAQDAGVDTNEAPAGASGFELRQAEGYLAAVLAACAYGTSPILFRAALEGETGLSIFSGLISYAAAGGVLLLGLLIPSQRNVGRALEPYTLKVFFGASFSVFIAQMLRFLALSLAPVAIVTSLERTNSAFTLILSWRLNPLLELITPRVIAGILTSMAGTLLLLVSI